MPSGWSGNLRTDAQLRDSTDGASEARRNGRGPAAAAGEEVERAMGIEPTLSAWEAEVLPLNYARGRR